MQKRPQANIPENLEEVDLTQKLLDELKNDSEITHWLQDESYTPTTPSTNFLNFDTPITPTLTPNALEDISPSSSTASEYDSSQASTPTYTSPFIAANFATLSTTTKTPNVATLPTKPIDFATFMTKSKPKTKAQQQLEEAPPVEYKDFKFLVANVKVITLRLPILDSSLTDKNLKQFSHVFINDDSGSFLKVHQSKEASIIRKLLSAYTITKFNFVTNDPNTAYIINIRSFSQYKKFLNNLINYNKENPSNIIDLNSDFIKSQLTSITEYEPKQANTPLVPNNATQSETIENLLKRKETSTAQAATSPLPTTPTPIWLQKLTSNNIGKNNQSKKPKTDTFAFPLSESSPQLINFFSTQNSPKTTNDTTKKSDEVSQINNIHKKQTK